MKMINDQYIRFAIIVLFAVYGASLNTPVLAQCNLNDCGASTSLSASAPIFNAANRSIQINFRY